MVSIDEIMATPVPAGDRRILDIADILQDALETSDYGAFGPKIWSHMAARVAGIYDSEGEPAAEDWLVDELMRGNGYSEARAVCRILTSTGRNGEQIDRFAPDAVADEMGDGMDDLY